MKKIKFPWGVKTLIKPKDIKTPVVYFGGKSRDALWIIDQFPPHDIFCEVFGGGGAVFFAKRPSTNDVYNDIGNVSVFMKALQMYGESIYNKLYFTPFSREVFERAHRDWPDLKYKAMNSGLEDDIVDWAVSWYIQISQSYTHSEFDLSWKVAKEVNYASGIKNHVDSLPFIIERLRSVTIEKRDFEDFITLYDKPNVLFYCDPPYLHDTRVSPEMYGHEMPYEDHIRLLSLLQKISGQVILSGYDSDLYNSYTDGWRKVTKTAKSSIQNSKQMDGRGDRTEVLWIKEHTRGLWTFEVSQTNVSGVSYSEERRTEAVEVLQ